MLRQEYGPISEEEYLIEPLANATSRLFRRESTGHRSRDHGARGFEFLFALYPAKNQYNSTIVIKGRP